MKNSVGVCTWSLQNNVDRVFQVLAASDLTRLHLDVAAVDAFRERIVDQEIRVTSTMVGFPQEDYSSLASIQQTGGIVPDDCWERNRQMALDAIQVTADLGVEFLSFHAGFIDEEDASGFRQFCDRMYELADAAAESGIMLLMETGQETAQDLRHFLDVVEHPALGVNFDPANMILYGKGDPIEAVHILAPWIRHVHIKDAVQSAVPGEWGTEVPWGDGEVGREAFIHALEAVGYTGALAIEREAGGTRAEDIRLAVQRLGEMK